MTMVVFYPIKQRYDTRRCNNDKTLLNFQPFHKFLSSTYRPTFRGTRVRGQETLSRKLIKQVNVLWNRSLRR